MGISNRTMHRFGNEIIGCDRDYLLRFECSFVNLVQYCHSDWQLADTLYRKAFLTVRRDGLFRFKEFNRHAPFAIRNFGNGCKKLL